MIIHRFDDEDALASALATRVLECITANPTVVLGLPTGRTPLAFYRQLRERSNSLSRRLVRRSATRGGGSPQAKADIDWSGVRAFNLDEFVGIGRKHPGAYHAYMCRELFDHVSIDPANIHIPNGQAEDLKAECRRYEAAIAAAGGIDLQILGIGTNGHIGFNEPADGLCASTHIAELEQKSRESNAELFGGDWRAVPQRAISMGMATILGARNVVLMATGPKKADAVYELVEGLITPKLPASFLQVHPRVTVMLDRGAASRLSAP